MITPSIWRQFSKKSIEKIAKGRFMGTFVAKEATEREMRLVVGKEGYISEGNALALFLLIDETDGVIVDVKYQLFGHAALMAVAEGLCELLVSKNYDQARRISVELIDKQLRDAPTIRALPQEASHYFDLALSALQDAVHKCLDIPLSSTLVSPVPSDKQGSEGYPGFFTLSMEQKLQVIEKVLDEEIRPYIELDAGGIELLNLVKETEVIIAYQGACTSCFSAIGATLSTIQEILQSKIDRSLTVVPNMDDLKFV